MPKSKFKNHPRENWEVSIIEFEEGSEKKFKVTRRLPDMSVAETRVFKTKKQAKDQFDQWLG